MHPSSSYYELSHSFPWNLYRPQTKLREGNVFTGVCLSTEWISPWVGGGHLWYQVHSWGSGGWVCPGVSMPQVRWVCPCEVGMSRWGGYVSGVGMSRGGYVHLVGSHHAPRYMGPGILRDTVHKWAICILLECSLVFFSAWTNLGPTFLIIIISGTDSGFPRGVPIPKTGEQRQPIIRPIFILKNYNA